MGWSSRLDCIDMDELGDLKIKQRYARDVKMEFTIIYDVESRDAELGGVFIKRDR